MQRCVQLDKQVSDERARREHDLNTRASHRMPIRVTSCIDKDRYESIRVIHQWRFAHDARQESTVMMSRRVYVLASDKIGWPIVRQAIERLPDCLDVAMTVGSLEAVTPLLRWRPDALLTARWVEGESVIPLLRLVRSRLPNTAFIILADDYALAELYELAEIGGASYLLWKDLSGSNLGAFLNAAIRDRAIVVSNEVATAYVANYSIETIEAHGSLLSDRERVVLRGLGDGLTQEEIALQLQVSRRTVESDVARLKMRLGASSAFALGLRVAKLIDE